MQKRFVTSNLISRGARPCGVGRSHDIVQASLAAIISALRGYGLFAAAGGLTAVNHIVSERHPCVTMKSLL